MQVAELTLARTTALTAALKDRADRILELAFAFSIGKVCGAVNEHANGPTTLAACAGIVRNVSDMLVHDKHDLGHDPNTVWQRSGLHIRFVEAHVADLSGILRPNTQVTDDDRNDLVALLGIQFAGKRNPPTSYIVVAWDDKVRAWLAPWPVDHEPERAHVVEAGSKGTYAPPTIWSVYRLIHQR